MAKCTAACPAVNGPDGIRRGTARAVPISGGYDAEVLKTDPDKDRKPIPDEPDFYVENGFVVYTAAYHQKRGFCCGSGCRHCPYEPRHLEGTTAVRRIGKTE